LQTFTCIQAMLIRLFLVACVLCFVAQISDLTADFIHDRTIVAKYDLQTGPILNQLLIAFCFNIVYFHPQLNTSASYSLTQLDELTSGAERWIKQITLDDQSLTLQSLFAASSIYLGLKCFYFNLN